MAYEKKSHDTLLIRASLMRLKVAAIICGGVIKPLCDFLDMPKPWRFSCVLDTCVITLAAVVALRV